MSACNPCSPGLGNISMIINCNQRAVPDYELGIDGGLERHILHACCNGRENSSENQHREPRTGMGFRPSSLFGLQIEGTDVSFHGQERKALECMTPVSVVLLVAPHPEKLTQAVRQNLTHVKHFRTLNPNLNLNL